MEEIGHDMDKYITNVYGNYVIQQMVKYGGDECVERVMESVRGNVKEYSVHIHACRIVQELIKILPWELTIEAMH